MNFQVRFLSQLHSIQYEELTVRTAARHFADFGYEYLYVFKNSKLYDVLSYHDFIIHGLIHREREYTVELSELNHITIEQYFCENPQINRLAVTDSGKILYEINNMTEPFLLHSVEKNLFSLRFVDLFYSELKEVLKSFRTALLLAPMQAADFIISRFHGIIFTVVSEADHIPEIDASDYDIVLDFLCGKKLLNLLSPDMEVYPFFHQVELIALEKLKDYAKQQDVSLYMYRIPTFPELNCLSPEERETYQNRKKIYDLLKDKTFLEKFCCSQEEMAFIQNRKISCSARQDDTLWYTQEDCCEDGLTVHTGVRRTIPNNKDASRSVHFFGPCTMLGMLVRDEDTIPSLFSRTSIRYHMEINSVNHGGLHGDNVLNSIAGALMTSVKPGDAIVILDFFHDFPQTEKIQNTAEWFNKEKSARKLCFFDYPEHCNKNGNSIFAENIWTDISKEQQVFRQNMEAHCYIDAVKYEFNRYFEVSHTAGVRMYAVISQLISENNEKNTGILVCYHADSEEFFGRIIKKALKFCECLFLFTSFDHADACHQLMYDAICQSYALYPGIKIVQLPHFFNPFRFCLKPDNSKEYETSVRITETCFMQTISRIQAKTRFCICEEDTRMQVVNTVVRSIAEGNGMKLIEL